MQTMNTEQHQFYSNTPGSHTPTGYFVQNGLDQPYSVRSPNAFSQSQRMTQPFYNQQIPTGYGQQQVYMSQPYLPAPFHVNGPRGTVPVVHVLRPPNETPNPTQSGYIQTAGYQTYPTNGLPQQQNMYSAQQFYSYQIPQPYGPQQTSSSQISNQTAISQSQPQYSTPSSQQQTHQAATSQSSPHEQSHALSSQSFSTQEKRQRKPLLIVDPVSHKPLFDLATPPSTTTNDNHQNDSVTDSTTPITKSADDANKTQKQTTFRQGSSQSLNLNAAPYRSVNQASVSVGSIDDPTDVTSTKQKQSENILSQSTSSASSSRSGSISRPKSPTLITENISKESTSNQPSDQLQPSYPGIRTRSTTEDKSNQDDSQRDRSDSEKQLETDSIETTIDNLNVKSDDTNDNSTNIPNDDNSSMEQIPSSIDSNPTINSQSTPSLSNAESLECVTPPQTPTPSNDTEPESINIEKTPSISKRLSYTIQELLSKRSDPSTLKRPVDLKPIDGVTNQNINRQMLREVVRSGVKPNISLDRPPLHNRSENAYKPADPNRIDADSKFLREVKSLLNKLTPQTYEKLLKKLDELELNHFNRLEGMIDIIFIKAVEEVSFCSLYAKLCKHFQKKQVTVPNEDGQPVTHYFRQILLSRCQKGFESDYRQEINYDKRKSDVDAITDEKVRKEEDEKLEEELAKAKRRKLGNIFFIGELFKLQMLVDTIMYDCVEYLLRDKNDEESLECLCRLLRTIGKELDDKAGSKSQTRTLMEKHYRELNNIFTQKQTSARMRFMIQDLMEQRKASWVARRVEAKPTTIDEIHEQERRKREQQEQDQERDRQQRREHNRGSGGGNNYGGNNPQQYSESRGSRGSGIKQQSNRTDDERTETRFNVNSVRQLQSNDKRNQGPLAFNLAPPRAWGKGSGVEKKLEDEQSNAGRAGKPPAGHVQNFKSKTGTSPGPPGYPVQRQPSRELARENSQRDRENAKQSLRKTTSNSGVTSPNNTSMTNSREGSRESSVSGRTSNANATVSIDQTSALSSTNDSTTIINNDFSNVSFDEEKTQARVHSLIEEYTVNYSDNNDRPVREAIEDLSEFCTSNIDQQGLVVRELFIKVLEAKPRARKAVGHLLDAALHNGILSEEGFLSGFKMVVEVVPDYVDDIPYAWQYIGEILGAFIGAPSSNILLLKPILQSIPDEKSKPKQLFQYIIRYATEFSSKPRIQRFWQSSGFSLNDLLKSDYIDASLTNEYDWLSEAVEGETTTPSPPIKENISPRADLQLVKLFKSVNDQGATVTDGEIISYIQKHMDSTEKFYIRKIVLSYLEACLINRDPQKKIQEDIAKNRMTVLNAIIEHKQEAEIQAVYAIQNFVDKLEHPPKMAQLLFDIFYDEECVSEDAFFEWLRNPDQSETEGHAVVEMSTKDFFNWLQQAETEQEGGEEES